jgi:hypothetical protein
MANNQKKGGCQKAARESDRRIVCARQRVIRWVQVPLSPGLGDSYPNLGAMPQGLVQCTRGQSVCRETEFEGLAEKYQAVTNGATQIVNWSAKDGIRSSLHYGDEGASSSPIVPRCLRAAWYGRWRRDPWRSRNVWNESTFFFSDEWLNKVEVVVLCLLPHRDAQQFQ